MELCGKGFFQLSGVSGGSQDLFREGNGVFTDEEDGGRNSTTVQGGARGGRRGGAGVYFILDVQNERRVSGADRGKVWSRE